MAVAIIAASFLVLLLASPTVYGVDHAVGGNSGWSLSGDYSTWSAGQNFTVGDNLVFKYDSSHGVDVVNEADYNSCSTSNALKSYSDGNTKIALSSAGKMYFICPTPGHCSSGMKLAVNVVAAGGSSPTTPSTPASGSPSTPATTNTTASPSPPKNGAVSAFGGFYQLMGTLFVSSIILALMS